MIDQRAHLFAAFWRIQRLGAALHRITDAVRFRAPASMPNWVQRHLFSRFSARQQRFRHHGETTTHSGEAAILGKTAKLDRTFFSSRNFENGMRNFAPNPHLAL